MQTLFKTPLTNKIVNIYFSSHEAIVFLRRTRLFRDREAHSCGDPAAALGPRQGWRWLACWCGRCRGSVADARSSPSHQSNHRNNPHPRIDLTLSSMTDGLKTFSQWGGFIRGCVCMCSASNGRKNRPRSAANIFQIAKSSVRDPERRESTESTRRAQRAMDDCRTVSVL